MKMKKFYLIALSSFIIITLLGCAPPPKADIIIDAGLQFKDYKEVANGDLNKYEEFQIAVENGYLSRNFYISGIKVLKGYLIFDMGYTQILLFPNDKIVIEYANGINAEFQSNRTGYFFIPINYFHVALRQMIINPKDAWWEETLGPDYMSFAEFIDVKRTQIGDFTLLEIKIIKSDDFVGDCGQLYTSSNWYDL